MNIEGYTSVCFGDCEIEYHSCEGTARGVQIIHFVDGEFEPVLPALEAQMRGRLSQTTGEKGSFGLCSPL
jgi:hypothetical protein